MNLQGIALVMIAVASLTPVAPDIAAQDQRDGSSHGAPNPGAVGREVSRILELLGLTEIKEELAVSIEQDRALKKLAEKTLADKSALKQFNFREMTDQQRKEAFDKMLVEQTTRFREMKQRLQEVLLPAQIERFEQISLQLRGVLALADPEVQRQLEITDQQVEELIKVRDAVHAKMREQAREFYQLGDREAMRQAFAELREEVEREVLSVLSPEQRARFEALKGEPFEMPERELVRREP